MGGEPIAEAGAPPIGASPLRDRVVFLVGARRSGTNWLERILTTHPEIVAMPSETYLFSHGIRQLSELVQHATPGSRTPGKTFVRKDSFRRAVRELVDEILLESLERIGPDARYLLERTPWHGQHLDLISELYPDARIIHIIRDGRAVSRSLVSMEFPGGPSTISEAATEWRDALAARIAGPRLFADRYTEVRYESLVADPRTGAGDLFRWLGLEPTDELIQRVVKEARVRFNVDPGSPRLVSDKWRSELSPADLAEIDRVAGAELRALGYSDEEGGQAVSAGGRARGGRRGVQLPNSAGRARRRLTTGRLGGAQRAARRRHRERMASRGVAERFAELVARGDHQAAAALCAPRCYFRLADATATSEGRGQTALETLLAALRDHHQTDISPVTSHTFASPGSVTTVVDYQLADGRRWVQTSVYEVRDGLIRGVSIYRFRLAAD